MDPLMEKYYHISPYSYCLNNPVNFVDPDGKEPDEYEAALMAAYAYKDKKSVNYIKILNERNWYVSNFKTSIKMNCTGFFGTGLQSMLFERTIDGKTEYAYAGTDKTSLKDIYADFTQLFGLSIQYTQAIRNARKLSEEVGDKELTFVGHSLGGGEATAASMATGRLAITFNTAAVSDKTISKNNLGYANNITNYIAVGTLIKTPLSIRLGGDVLNNFQRNTGQRVPGKIIKVPAGMRPTHGIKLFVDKFAP